jgi:sugar lactone lactonase YvrE
MVTPQVVADYQCINAECPLWHSVERKLYWTDIPQGKLFRYDPATGESTQVYTGTPVGGITMQEDGALLLFKTRGTIERFRNGKVTTIIPEIPAERDTRFNDAKADLMGRVFSGTMATSTHKGRLYRLDPDGTIHKLLEGVEISNGVGFSPDRQYMYHTDSDKGEIYRFDYDVTTGKISNQEVLIRIRDTEGVPDGLTVDAAGYIWSARWNGSALYRYTPDGKEVLRIPFPAKKVSSLAFGGDDYTDIYVTTAGGDNRAEEGEGAGAVFHLNLGIQGRPEFVSKIRVH